MITVRCVGHIRTSVGADVVELDAEQLDVAELVERLRKMAKGGPPGFDAYNVLAMVEDGEAFVPASSARKVKDGARVVLIPFSHGG